MSDKPGAPGRPSSYTPEIAAAICLGLATGTSLNKVCEPDGFPAPSTVISWHLADVHGFSEHYTRAREAQHHALADQIIDLANEEPPKTKNAVTGELRIDPGYEAWRKTRIAALQWAVSKILFRLYGEKLQVDHTVTLDPNRLSDGDLARIAMQGKTINGTAAIVPQKVIAA